MSVLVLQIRAAIPSDMSIQYLVYVNNKITLPAYVKICLLYYLILHVSLSPSDKWLLCEGSAQTVTGHKSIDHRQSTVTKTLRHRLQALQSIWS